MCRSLLFVLSPGGTAQPHDRHRGDVRATARNRNYFIRVARVAVVAWGDWNQGSEALDYAA